MRYNNIMQPIDFTVDRDGWDPDDNTPAATRTLSSINGFELHHTGGAGPKSNDFTDKAEWLLSIERYHEESRGWSDIFYNVFVFSDGEVWEGRRSDRSSQTSVSQYLTVHIPGNNLPVTEPQYQSLLRVARSITQDPGRIRGHSDRAATACPGDTGRAALARIQKELTMPIPDLTNLVPQDFSTNSDYLTATRRKLIGLDAPARVASRSVVGIVATRVDDDARERDKATRMIVAAVARDVAAAEAALSQRITILEAQVASLSGANTPHSMQTIIDAVRADLAADLLD
jgi:hypothetical protein